MNDIAIFPGTFNPIHKGHLKIAETALQEFNFKKIIFITSKIPPHRMEDVESAHHRYKMTELAIQGNPAFESSDIELLRQGTSYTYETTLDFKQKLKTQPVNLIIGSDAFTALNTWHNYIELIKISRFLVYQRTNTAPIKSIVEKLNTSLPHGLVISYCSIPGNFIDISSSTLREKIRNNLPINDAVPQKVADYIIENRLYST